MDNISVILTNLRAKLDRQKLAVANSEAHIKALEGLTDPSQMSHLSEKSAKK